MVARLLRQAVLVNLAASKGVACDPASMGAYETLAPAALRGRLAALRRAGYTLAHAADWRLQQVLLCAVPADAKVVSDDVLSTPVRAEHYRAHIAPAIQRLGGMAAAGYATGDVVLGAACETRSVTWGAARVTQRSSRVLPDRLLHQHIVCLVRY